MGDTDLYGVLGVSRNATLSEIRKVSVTVLWFSVSVNEKRFSPQAYHRLARQYHPDKGGNDEEKVTSGEVTNRLLFCSVSVV